MFAFPATFYFPRALIPPAPKENKTIQPRYAHIACRSNSLVQRVMQVDVYRAPGDRMGPQKLPGGEAPSFF
jgi:hypothetical protein